MTSVCVARAWASKLKGKPYDLMKIVDVEQRGKRGKTVAGRNRFGQFHYEWVCPEQPGTAAQCGVWGNMKVLSRLFNELTPEQMAAWRALALKVHSRPKLGQSGPLDGCQLFKKINRVLATCGREPLFDPPPLPVFGANPVEGFTISTGKGGPVFKLRVGRKVRWEARPPLEDIMVFGWAPYNAGVDKNSLYAFLGLAPAPEGGEIDIRGLYMKKLKEWRKLKDKRYHVRLEGAKVFIRVWQQVNGWENELRMFRGSALVPANGGEGRGAGKGRRQAGKAGHQ